MNTNTITVNDSHEMPSQQSPPQKVDAPQPRKAQGVMDPFHTPSDRVGINILSEYCRILSENRFYNPVHEVKKFSAVLNLFAEVCPVIYQNNVKGQLKNLAAYFRKRLLQQHIFVVEVFMNEIRETGFIVDDSIYQRLANELERREWNNDMTEEEKRTLVLRQEAKKQYKRVLPLYTKDLNRMYPNITCPIDDETLYRTLNIYGGGTTGAGSSPERSPFQNADKQKIEKEFEMRSRHMKVKSRQQNTYVRNDRGRGHVAQPRRRNNPPTTIVRPQYGVSLTKEALQHHHQRQQANMRALNPYANPYEEFWHPYADQPRYPTYPGRRALSDGGFEMEDQGGPQRQERARSDDAGPIYRGHHSGRNVHAGEQSFDVGMHFNSTFFDDVQSSPHSSHYSPHNKHHSPHNSVHSPLSEHHGSPRASHISPRHHQSPQQNHLRQAPTSNKYLRVKRQAALPSGPRMYCTPSPPPHVTAHASHSQAGHHQFSQEDEQMLHLTADGMLGADQGSFDLFRNAFRI